MNQPAVDASKDDWRNGTPTLWDIGLYSHKRRYWVRRSGKTVAIEFGRLRDSYSFSGPGHEIRDRFENWGESCQIEEFNNSYWVVFQAPPEQNLKEIVQRAMIFAEESPAYILEGALHGTP